MQVPAAACCSISAAKYLFEVKCVTDSAMVRCKKKSKSSARDVFMTAQAALLRSEKPDIDDERLQEQLQNLWKKWLLDQGRGKEKSLSRCFCLYYKLPKSDPSVVY